MSPRARLASLFSPFATMIHLPNLCADCVSDIELSERSIQHSMQHFPDGPVDSVEQAGKYARADRSTSVIVNHRLGEIMSELRGKRTQWEFKAGLGQGKEKASYVAHLSLSDGRYDFRVVVCEQEFCDDDVAGVIIKNGRRKGEVMTLYPVCGPKVWQIPALYKLERFSSRSPELINGLGTKGAKISNVLCK